MAEFVIGILIILLFSVCAPLSASKKRSETQKLLAQMLLEQKFATSAVIDAGEMSLYIDRINRQFFVRASPTDLNCVIYPYEALTCFEVLDDGNKIFSASDGRIAVDFLFSADKLPLLQKSGNCSSLLVTLRLNGSRSPDIVIPLLTQSVSRRFFAYREAIDVTRTLAAALAEICGCPNPK